MYVCKYIYIYIHIYILACQLTVISGFAMKPPCIPKAGAESYRKQEAYFTMPRHAWGSICICNDAPTLSVPSVGTYAVPHVGTVQCQICKIHNISTNIGHRFGHQSGVDESSRQNSGAISNVFAFCVYLVFPKTCKNWRYHICRIVDRF